eukprot:CAMPEP_0177581504 /NCGR_PEP_ID=MMETSP0419_2-20121207/2184_1 /TAXON_ID=582737 /ORGANISM="Tetraselmis sp., Strain GSL018" /LENGTH=233 /DNA_ID=CAMNT_0019070553 /DNA_START=974 /DNA_END=1673 /DNA_ORIENTATION=-
MGHGGCRKDSTPSIYSDLRAVQDFVLKTIAPQSNPYQQPPVVESPAPPPGRCAVEFRVRWVFGACVEQRSVWMSAASQELARLLEAATGVAGPAVAVSTQWGGGAYMQCECGYGEPLMVQVDVTARGEELSSRTAEVLRDSASVLLPLQEAAPGVTCVEGLGTAVQRQGSAADRRVRLRRGPPPILPNPLRPSPVSAPAAALPPDITAAPTSGAGAASRGSERGCRWQHRIPL